VSGWLQLYNPSHHVWVGTKPQLMKRSPSFTDLEKHQLVYLQLQRIAWQHALAKQKAGWRCLLVCDGSSETVTPARDVKAKVKFSVQSGTNE